MNVLVCYPPDPSIPTMPFGTLPLFNACLREAGHSVKVVDLAAFTFKHLMASENLERQFALLDHELGKPRSELTRTSAEVYRGLSHLRAIPRELVLDAEASFHRLRDPEHYTNPEQMLRDTRALYAVDRVFSVVRPSFDPAHLDFTESLYAYLDSDAFNPWVQCYEEHLLDELREFAPDLVALSVPFATQHTATLCFAKWIRKHFPSTKLVVGGTAINASEELLLSYPRFYEFIDFAIAGEGDNALPELASKLEADVPLDEISFLYRMVDGEVQKTTRQDLPNMDESPTYDYTDIDLDLYALPEPIASLTTSRGCYYGKCSFCPETLKGGFRRRNSPQVWEDIRDIATRQGIKNFMFWDPLTPAGVMKEISTRSIEEGVDIRWMAQVKFEEMYTDPEFIDLIRRGGCKTLQFGFESGVQRVLDDMAKGNDLEEMEVILPLLKAKGIAVGVFFFIGFPTELEEDAKESWRYLVRHLEEIPFAGYLGTFGIGPSVPVGHDPEKYGIELYRSDLGNITYRRLDGKDWDPAHLHEVYFARNDQLLIEGGAPLLYGTLAPDKLDELSARREFVPPAFVRGELSGAALSIPDCNGFTTLEAFELDGERLWPTERIAYSGSSHRMHFIDEEDLRLVEAVRAGASSDDLADSAQRLARLLDFGILDADASEPTLLLRAQSQQAPTRESEPQRFAAERS